MPHISIYRDPNFVFCFGFEQSIVMSGKYAVVVKKTLTEKDSGILEEVVTKCIFIFKQCESIHSLVYIDSHFFLFKIMISGFWIWLHFLFLDT